MRAKLYSAGQVLLATFLGSPFAGVVLMASNDWYLGRTRSAKLSYLYGGLASFLLMVIAFILPDDSPGIFLPLLSLAAMGFWYQKSYARNYRLAVEEGGETGSWWFAIAVGVACLAAVLFLIFLMFLVLSG